MIRIALTGPESTGKSELAERLALHYNTLWVPEFAREYIASINRSYTLDDILLIAQKQFEHENAAALNANFMLFCDTEATVTKIWAEHSYRQCPEWIRENIASHHYDLYLLCNIDLPWQQDPQREHPHLRAYFFNLYQKELSDRNVPFAVISGNGESRLQNALEAVETMLKSKK
ncbi:MAG: ATP-binding protein [Bacteroidota bacterium]